MATSAKISAPATATPNSKGSGTTLLLLLLMVGVSAACGWLWQQQRLHGQQIQRLIHQQQQSSDQFEARQTQLMEQQKASMQQAIQQAVTAASQPLQQRLDDQQQGLLQLSESRQRERNRHWLLEDTIYLLDLAEQRAQLEQAPARTLAVLYQARQQLQRIDDAAVLPAIEALQSQIAIQNSHQGFDRERALMQLDQLAIQTEQLTLRPPRFSYPAEPAISAKPSDQLQLPTDMPQWRQFGAQLWADIRTLFRITPPKQASVAPPPTSQQQPLIRQQVEIQLQMIRLALLSQQLQPFQTAIDNLLRQLHRYYTPAEVDALQIELAGFRSHFTPPPIVDTTLIRQLLRPLSVAPPPTIDSNSVEAPPQATTLPVHPSTPEPDQGSQLEALPVPAQPPVPTPNLVENPPPVTPPLSPTIQQPLVPIAPRGNYAPFTPPPSSGWGYPYPPYPSQPRY